MKGVLGGSTRQSNGLFVYEYGDSQVNCLTEGCGARRINVMEVAKNKLPKKMIE